MADGMGNTLITPGPTTEQQPLLVVENLSKNFPLGDGRVVQACQDVSFTLRRGETMGLVGESGSGKTTLGRCALRLIEPSGGKVAMRGEDILGLSRKQMRARRAKAQIVFQEPVESLNPRLKIGAQIAEPLRIHTDLDRAGRRRRVAEVLDMVGLPASLADSYPASLSAGVAQRCSVARALATEPDFLVLDEPTSALAPESETELIALLKRLQDELGIAYIFISHDLSLIGEVCDRIAVMYLSQIVEIGTVEDVFGNPQHPYTKALLAATLLPTPQQRHDTSKRWQRLGGEIPSPVDLPNGCYLAGRCPYVQPRCREQSQTLELLDNDRRVRCWRITDHDLTQADYDHARETALAALEQHAAVLVEEVGSEVVHRRCPPQRTPRGVSTRRRRERRGVGTP